MYQFYKKKDRRLSLFLFLFHVYFELVENDDVVKRKAGIVEDGLTGLLVEPWAQILVVVHKVHDPNDVMMRLRIDGICGERIRAGKGLVDAIIDIGILGNRNRLVGREEVLEEGENGWHG